MLKRVIGALHCDNADHYVHNMYIICIGTYLYVLPRTNQILGLVLTVPLPFVQMGKKISTKIDIAMLGSIVCSELKRVIGALHCENADHYV